MPAATFPTTTPCVRATTYFRSPERQAMSVTTYWEPQSDYSDPAILQGDVNDFDTQFKTVLKVFMPALCQILMTRAVFTRSSVFLECFSDNPPVIGSIAQDLALEYNGIPDQDALIIQRRTGLAGRQHRGRIFIPCIAESVQDFGRIDAGDSGSVKAVAVFLGADVTVPSNLWHARHWNRKDNVLEVVTQCRTMRTLGSRRDRQTYAPRLPVP